MGRRTLATSRLYFPLRPAGLASRVFPLITLSNCFLASSFMPEDARNRPYSKSVQHQHENRKQDQVTHGNSTRDNDPAQSWVRVRTLPGMRLRPSVSHPRSERDSFRSHRVRRRDSKKQIDQRPAQDATRKTCSFIPDRQGIASTRLPRSARDTRRPNILHVPHLQYRF